MQFFLHNDTMPYTECRNDFLGAFLWSFVRNDVDKTKAFPVVHRQLTQCLQFFWDLTGPLKYVV
jgi:hypothetical protein